MARFAVRLQASIQKAQADAQELTDRIADLDASISKADADLKAQHEERDREHQDYLAEVRVRVSRRSCVLGRAVWFGVVEVAQFGGPTVRAHRLAGLGDPLLLNGRLPTCC